MNENKEHFKVTNIKSDGFKLVLLLIAIAVCLPIISAVIGVNGHFLEGSPKWFFYVSIGISIVSLISLYYIYQLKKVAVYALFISIIAQYLWYLIAYGIEFFDTIFALFLCIGIGLFVIIPRWKYFN